MLHIKKQLWILLLYLIVLSFGINNSLKQIENQKESCLNNKRCQIGSSNNCQCDEKCINYGDCCLDAKTYDQTKILASFNRYECVFVAPLNLHIYMKAQCMEGWADSRVEELCYKAKFSGKVLGDDPFLETPVTSMISKVTYKNYYCAVCNGESLGSIQQWMVQVTNCNFQCNCINKLKLTAAYINNHYGVYVIGAGNSSFVKCSVQIMPHQLLVNNLRMCTDTIKTCSSNIAEISTLILCMSYNDLVQDSVYLTKYRNYHCALCNNVPENNIRCLHDDRSFSAIVARSFPSLPSRAIPTCCKGYVWDEFHIRCRLIDLDYKISVNYSCTFIDECLVDGNCSKKKECNSDSGRCQCDNACIDYGDCCLEAESYNSTTMVGAVNNYECIYIPNIGTSIFMKGKCIEGWPNDRVKQFCSEAHFDYYINFRMPILETPVTNKITNVTYRNYYCAICNNDPLLDIKPWVVEMTCEGGLDLKVRTIHYINNTYGVYEDVNKTGGSKFYKCKIKVVIPQTLIPHVRQCDDYISSCSSLWTEPIYKSLCHSYTNLVQNSITHAFYRNYHCAICNYVDVNLITCSECRKALRSYADSSLTSYYFSRYDFPCHVSSLHWFHFPKNCEQVKQSNYCHIKATLQYLHKCEIFSFEFFAMIDKYIIALKIVRVISSCCIVLHLIATLTLLDNKNINSMNLFSLCVVLLIRNCLKLFLFSDGERSCLLTFSFDHYSFLTIMSWMNVISFDVWRSIQNATTNLRVSSGQQWKKFVYYSAYAYLVPWIPLGLILVFDQYKPAFVPESYIPNVGGPNCTFQGLCAYNLYYKLPVLVSFLANVFFYFLAIWTLKRNANLNNKLKTNKNKRSPLLLHIKLASLMGLIFVCEILIQAASHLYIHAYYLLQFSYDFQGIFIFIAYTCDAKGLSNLLRYKALLFEKLKISKNHKTNKLNLNRLTKQTILSREVTCSSKL